MDLYQKKYLKYKQKYITLKQSLYGGMIEVPLNDSTGIFSNNVIIFKESDAYFLFCYVIKADKVKQTQTRQDDPPYKTNVRAHFYYSKYFFKQYPTGEELAAKIIIDSLHDKKIKCFISQTGKQLSLQYNEEGKSTPNTILTGFKLYEDADNAKAMQYYEVYHLKDYLKYSNITISSGEFEQYNDILKKAGEAEILAQVEDKKNIAEEVKVRKAEREKKEADEKAAAAAKAREAAAKEREAEAKAREAEHAKKVAAETAAALAVRSARERALKDRAESEAFENKIKVAKEYAKRINLGYLISRPVGENLIRRAFEDRINNINDYRDMISSINFIYRNILIYKDTDKINIYFCSFMNFKPRFYKSIDNSLEISPTISFENYLKKEKYFSIITWAINSFKIIFVSRDNKITLCNINDPSEIIEQEEIKREFDTNKESRLNILDIVSNFDNLTNLEEIKKKPEESKFKDFKKSDETPIKPKGASKKNKLDDDFLPPEDTMFFDGIASKNFYMHKWYEIFWAHQKSFIKN
jgi:hypothetical protein